MFLHAFQAHFLCWDRIRVAPLDCPCLCPASFAVEMGEAPILCFSCRPARGSLQSPPLLAPLPWPRSRALHVQPFPSGSAESPLRPGLFSQPPLGTRSVWPVIHLHIQPLQLSRQAFIVTSYPLKGLSSSGGVLCPHVDKQE